MKLLVTGANGFIGKNLICELQNRGYTEIMKYDINTNQALLDDFCKNCDFVFHLAGINRPEKEEEYMKENLGFTSLLIEKLDLYKNNAPILITSSIQATQDNPYGKSKRAMEEIMLSRKQKTGNKIFIYRLPNVFGKWCRPNYNSVIATFCYNTARNLDIKINDPSTVIRLAYIDDVIAEFIDTLESTESKTGTYLNIPVFYMVSLVRIASLIQSFKESRKTLSIPNMSNDFEKKLYSTYLSYLPEEEFSYNLTMNVDNRGSFTEFVKTEDRGQFSVNISKPGIVKGNHWHRSKTEKFLVVKGYGLIQFRKIDSDKVVSYHVSERNLEVIDIPPGYTHNIINEGEEDLITLIWANESFQPENPDTYYLDV